MMVYDFSPRISMGKQITRGMLSRVLYCDHITMSYTSVSIVNVRCVEMMTKR